MVLDGRVNAGLTCAMIHDLITAFLVAFAAVTASNCSSRFGSSSSRSGRRGVSRRPPGTLRPARHIHSKATSEAALIVIAGPRSWRFAPLPPRGKRVFSIARWAVRGGPWSVSGASVTSSAAYRRVRSALARGPSVVDLSVAPTSHSAGLERAEPARVILLRTKTQTTSAIVKKTPSHGRERPQIERGHPSKERM